MDKKEESAKIRELVAKREEARAALRLAEADVAKQRAAVSKIKAKLIREDVDRVLNLSDIMRW